MHGEMRSINNFTGIMDEHSVSWAMDVDTVWTLRVGMLFCVTGAFGCATLRDLHCLPLPWGLTF